MVALISGNEPSHYTPSKACQSCVGWSLYRPDKPARPVCLASRRSTAPRRLAGDIARQAFATRPRQHPAGAAAPRGFGRPFLRPHALAPAPTSDQCPNRLRCLLSTPVPGPAGAAKILLIPRDLPHVTPSTKAKHDGAPALDTPFNTKLTSGMISA